MNGWKVGGLWRQWHGWALQKKGREGGGRAGGRGKQRKVENFRASGRKEGGGGGCGVFADAGSGSGSGSGLGWSGVGRCGKYEGGGFSLVVSEKGGEVAMWVCVLGLCLCLC